ncbi:MAG TPA: CBS domain-containing protein [Candidatus Binatia bacterium]|jgi:CBS domain-containing protein|nr:CBS domain-containing protein [Candidatus Binatia bacterium]
MKIRDILHGKGAEVVTIHPEATVHQAMQVLVHHRIGSLVVIGERGKIAGIITERDILRECAAHSEGVKETTVREVMTTNLIIGVPDDEVSYVMGIMTHNRIRHLPIIDGERLEGMISIGDVVKAQLEETEFENHYLKDYIQRQ